MGFEIAKETYSGKIKEIQIGKGENALSVGGETCYPFYEFEGEMPNRPRIAMEVWDMEPDDWPEPARKPFEDVLADPVAWAQKCVNESGADLIVLQLKSTDPNGQDAGAEQAVATVKKVLQAIDVPLVVWGTTNVQKDEEVLKKISEECDGENLVLGPVEDANHKAIGASAMGFGHTVASSSPIDVNLAKQINILLENLGMPMERMIIDPTTGGLGYGMEYSYSVMERIRMAALTQGDDKLQLPIINNLANEIWRCKEAKLGADEAPELGDPERRGVLMEAVGAVTYLLAGSDVLILRHPETVRLVKSFIDLLSLGGSAHEVEGVQKIMPEPQIDYAALAPEPDLNLEGEEKPAKKAAEKKEEKPVAEKEAAEPAVKEKEEPAPKEPAKPAAKQAAEPAKEDKAQEEETAKAKAEETEKAKEEEARIKAEQEEKARKEAEEKAKKEAEAKAKAEEEAKAKKEAEEKARKEAEAKAAEEEKRKKQEAEEDALRQSLSKERKAKQEAEVQTKTAAEAGTEVGEESVPDSILATIKRFHRK